MAFPSSLGLLQLPRFVALVLLMMANLRTLCQQSPQSFSVLGSLRVIEDAVVLAERLHEEIRVTELLESLTAQKGLKDMYADAHSCKELEAALDRAGELDLENDTVSKASNKHNAVSRMRTCEDGLKSGAADFSKQKIDSSLAELQALQSEFADQVQSLEYPRPIPLVTSAPSNGIYKLALIHQTVVMDMYICVTLNKCMDIPTLTLGPWRLRQGGGGCRHRRPRRDTQGARGATA